MIKIQSSFFQLEKKKGKTINSPEQKSLQIMTDLGGIGFKLYGRDEKLSAAYGKTEFK